MWESKIVHNSSNNEVSILQSELATKNQTIERLEELYKNSVEDVQLVKNDLFTVRSYMKTLPTQREIEHVKKELKGCRDEQFQQIADIERFKRRNVRLEAQISDLKETVFNLSSALEKKTTEVETLRDTVKLWEQRRKAAAQAGEMTVEDVLVQKSDLEAQLVSTLEYIAKRENNFKCKLRAFEVGFILNLIHE